MRLRYYVLMIVTMTISISSCMHVQDITHDSAVPFEGPPLNSHNEHGGYRDACGELPPLVGDDC